MLHPESQTQLQNGTDYLDSHDLLQISKAYNKNKGHYDNILRRVAHYHSIMTNPESSQEEKLEEARNAAILLQRDIDVTTDKGFGLHVLKKMHFDIQQRLQAMTPPENRPANLSQAFAAALKLDKVQVFNKIVAEAIQQNKVNTPAFRNFLQACIHQEAQAGNHAQAVAASNRIEQQGHDLLETLTTPVPIQENIEDSQLASIAPSHIREEELVEERRQLDDTEIVAPSDSEPTETQSLEKGKSTVDPSIKLNT